MKRNVVVVGGGLAGLAAAVYLARGGCNVTLFEKRRNLGGRAVTHLRHGFRFNLGAHAVFRAGAAAAVYRELGIPVRGGKPKSQGLALRDGEMHRFPATLFSSLFTSLLTLGAKLELAGLLVRIWRTDPASLSGLTARKWLDDSIAHADLRQFVEALLRLATYADYADEQSAASAVAQLKVALRGVVYVDEGWQKLVDSLHSAAVSAGVNFVTSARVVGVHHDGESVTALELGGLEFDADRMDTQSIALPDLNEPVEGVQIPADTVVLAVDPVAAVALIGDASVTRTWMQVRPVAVSCLDVALSRLPAPRNMFALGIDQPYYYAVHSKWAQLTPRGGALVHLVKYRSNGGAGNEEQELETLLDRLQPGWRDHVVHRRFLPSLVVTNALATDSASRPEAVTPLRGLYIAGDWVGREGMLSDAALSSARAAAKAILSVA